MVSRARMAPISSYNSGPIAFWPPSPNVENRLTVCAPNLRRTTISEVPSSSSGWAATHITVNGFVTSSRAWCKATRSAVSVRRADCAVGWNHQTKANNVREISAVGMTSLLCIEVTAESLAAKAAVCQLAVGRGQWSVVLRAWCLVLCALSFVLSAQYRYHVQAPKYQVPNTKH